MADPQEKFAHLSTIDRAWAGNVSRPETDVLITEIRRDKGDMVERWELCNTNDNIGILWNGGDDGKSRD